MGKEPKRSHSPSEHRSRAINKEKKKHKRKRESNHRSRSSSSAELKRSNSEQRRSEAKRIQPGVLEANPSSKRPPIRFKVNSSLLTHIISDQKKVNRKLDAEETGRAAYKFKEIFTQQIKPVTMSQFLSDEALQKRVEIKQIRGKECLVCGASFESGLQLAEHIKVHE